MRSSKAHDRSIKKFTSAGGGAAVRRCGCKVRCCGQSLSVDGVRGNRIGTERAVGDK